MSPVLGENCPHRTTISRWYKQFQSGKFDFEDNPHTDRPLTAVTSEHIRVAVIEKLLFTEEQKQERVR